MHLHYLLLLSSILVVVNIHIIIENTSQLFFNQNGVNVDRINQVDLDGFKLTLILAVIIAISLGILWISLVHMMPAYAPYIAYVLLAIALIISGVYLLLTKNM